MKARVPSTEQMRDARVLEWMFGQLRAAKVQDDDARVAGLEALFSEELVRHWLKSRQKMMAVRLLEVIPVPLFLAIAPDLEERYFRLGKDIARAFLFRLAGCEPERALSLLEAILERARGPRDSMALAFAVHVAEAIGELANPLLRRLIESCTGKTAGYHLYWSGLFKAMVHLDLKDGPQRIAGGLIATDSPGFEGEAIMHDLFAALAPGCPFLDMLMDIEFRQSGYRFADTPELFRADAPVEEFDRLAEADGHSLMGEALALLPDVGPSAEVASFCRALAAQMPRNAPPRVLRLTHLLVVAAYAAQYLCSRSTWKELEYKQLVEVATADIPILPHEDELLAQLVLRTGEKELPILHRELEAARLYRGAERLVRVLADIRHPSSLAALLWCLDIETEELAAELAVVALARYGERVLAPLRDGWPQMDEFSRMRALEVLGLVGGPTAAGYLLHFFADACQEDLSMGAWCDAAQAVPDGRYLSLLESPRYKENAELKRTLEHVKALVA